MHILGVLHIAKKNWLPSFSSDILAKEEVSGEGPGLSIGTGEVSLNERD